jgi:hypothetical protein
LKAKKANMFCIFAFLHLRETETKTSARGGGCSFSDKVPLKRLLPCPPWLVANPRANVRGHQLLDADKPLLSVRQYLLGIHVIVPVPGDRVFVSSCLVSLIYSGSGGKKTVARLRVHT